MAQQERVGALTLAPPSSEVLSVRGAPEGLSGLKTLFDYACVRACFRAGACCSPLAGGARLLPLATDKNVC